MASISITGIDLGLLIGAIPTIAMIGASITLTNIDVNKKVEATLQKFAAGLILGAVTSELFPLMLENVSKNSTLIGVSVGFFLGLIILNSMEKLINYIVDSSPAIDEPISNTNDNTDNKSSKSFKSMNVSITPYPNGQLPITQIINRLEAQENAPFEVSTETTSLKQELFNQYTPVDWEEGPVLQASVSMQCTSLHIHLL